MIDFKSVFANIFGIKAPEVKQPAPVTAGPVDIKSIFTDIFDKKTWGGKQSVSGTGSDKENTIILTRKLTEFIREHKIKSLFDAPCGDMHWMADVLAASNLESYAGMDIVPGIIAKNLKTYGGRLGDTALTLASGDITTDPLPPADMMICRDCLVHLSHANIGKFFRNLRSSRIRLIAITDFVGPTRQNIDMPEGPLSWSPWSFRKSPFNFPAPLAIIDEEYREQPDYSDKALSIWRVEDLTQFIG